MANILKDFVVENSTTTGTGSLTLNAAINNMKRFSDVCSVGDDVRYIIKGVDSTGVPTGEWEVVEGKYSAANTLTRVTVIASSNAGSLVNFSAGTKQVYMGADATMLSWVREKLTAARTYYVRTDGSDSNNGLANTSGGAFLTIQKAVNVVYGLDISTYNVTIQVADGTYTGAVVCNSPFLGSGTVTIQGNNTTPANVVLSTGANITVFAQNSAAVTVKDLKVTNTGNNGLRATTNATINFQNIDFGSVGASHVLGDDTGSVVCTGNYSISGGGLCHMRASAGFVRVSSRTVTLSGTPAFSTAFAQAVTAGVVTAGSNTYSGTGATGVRYDVSQNSVVNTNAGGASYFPGNAAGTAATGGQYI